MNVKKLLSKGHLIPIYKVEGDTIMLMGYRRKETSRKRSQRPFMLQAAIPIAKIPTNPASEVTDENPEISPKNINKE